MTDMRYDTLHNCINCINIVHCTAHACVTFNWIYFTVQWKNDENSPEPTNPKLWLLDVGTLSRPTPTFNNHVPYYLTTLKSCNPATWTHAALSRKRLSPAVL